MMGKKIAKWFKYALFAAAIALLIYAAMSGAFVAAYPFHPERIFLGDPPPATPLQGRV